jgi:hypothetical protein
MNKDLVEYIKGKLSEQYSREGIWLALQNAGYSRREIDEAFHEALKPVPEVRPVVFEEPAVEERHEPRTPILTKHMMVLVAIVIVFSVVSVAAIYLMTTGDTFAEESNCVGFENFMGPTLSLGSDAEFSLKVTSAMDENVGITGITVNNDSVSGFEETVLNAHDTITLEGSSPVSGASGVTFSKEIAVMYNTANGTAEDRGTCSGAYQ